MLPIHIDHLTQHGGLPMDEKPYPHLPIATPLHGIKYIAKGPHPFIFYLLHAMESMYLEALSYLLWLGQPLRSLRWHDTKDRTCDKPQVSRSAKQYHWHDTEARPAV